MNFRQWTDEILEARKAKGMTHRELAEALGYSEKYLYNVLEGKSRSQKAAMRISNYLGVMPYTYPTGDTCQKYIFNFVAQDGELQTHTDKVLAFTKTLIMRQETFTLGWQQYSCGRCLSLRYCCIVTVVDPSEDYTDAYNQALRRGV